jgi:hypothetical protein
MDGWVSLMQNNLSLTRLVTMRGDCSGDRGMKQGESASASWGCSLGAVVPVATGSTSPRRTLATNRNWPTVMRAPWVCKRNVKMRIKCVCERECHHLVFPHPRCRQHGEK